MTLTATVAAVSPGAGTPTGTVDFMNGSTSLGTGTLTNGVATFADLEPDGPATNSITADYAGDRNFAASHLVAVSA